MSEQLIPVQEVIFTPAPDLAKSVVIVSAAVIEFAQMAKDRGDNLVIDNDGAYQEAAKVLNELGRTTAAIKNNALALGKPFRDESARIKAEVDLVLDPLAAAQSALGNKMMAYKKQKDAEFAAARAEQERKRLEAERREAEAKKSLEKATTEKGFEAAAKKFDGAIAVAAAAELVPMPAPVAVRGVRTIKTPVIVSYDLATLALTYHEANEAKIKKHILDGTITKETPGIKFRIDEGFTGSGR